MAINITSLANFFVKVRGDAPTGNFSGTDAANGAVFEQFNREVGELSDTPATSDTGPFTILALLKRKLMLSKPTRYSVAAAPSKVTLNLTASQVLFPASVGRKIIDNGTNQNIYVLLGAGIAAEDNRSYVVYPGSSVEEDFEGAAQVVAAAAATGQINVTVLT